MKMLDIVIFGGTGDLCLRKLMPALYFLHGQGKLPPESRILALITDGRMSGASGKIPAAIHLTPEALDGGPISLVQNGDIIELNAISGDLVLHVSQQELHRRTPAPAELAAGQQGMGRELFSIFRHAVGSAETGAGIFLQGEME